MESRRRTRASSPSRGPGRSQARMPGSAIRRAVRPPAQPRCRSSHIQPRPQRGGGKARSSPTTSPATVSMPAALSVSAHAASVASSNVGSPSPTIRRSPSRRPARTGPPASSRVAHRKSAPSSSSAAAPVTSLAVLAGTKRFAPFREKSVSPVSATWTTSPTWARAKAGSDRRCRRRRVSSSRSTTPGGSESTAGRSATSGRGTAGAGSWAAAGRGSRARTRRADVRSSATRSG